MMLCRTVPDPRVRRAAIRLSFLLVSMLILLSCAARRASAQPNPGTGDANTFLQGLAGEWVGTCEQTNNGEQADTKYFHAVAKPANGGGYQIVLDYYRLDRKTGASVAVGTSTMTTTISPDGRITNRVTGSGDVMIDEKTTKPERHDVSELLRLCPTGELQGSGSGTVNVSGLPMGAGKNGQVRDYQSTWSRNGDVLRICQQMSVKFKVLFFSKTLKITTSLQATPGNDLAGLMQKARAGLGRNTSG